jgi:hypothetical protein
MIELKNTSRSPLGLPNGRLLEPRAVISLRPAEWDAMKDNKIVVAWQKNGMLASSVPPATSPVKPPADNEKAEVLAKLEALGIKKDKRTSLENLQKALAEAEAAADESEKDSGEDEQD